MMEVSRWKIWLVTIVTMIGVLFTVPNFLTPDMRRDYPSFLPSAALNLGLDLQGGSYLLLEVDTVDMFRVKKNNLLEDVRGRLREKNIAFGNLAIVGDSVTLRILDAKNLSEAQKTLATLASPVGTAGVLDWSIARGPDQTIVLSLTEAGMKAESQSAVDRSIEIVRKRIDSLGTKEPSIMRQGLNRIVVQAPGESDPEQLKRVIGQTAKLTFQMVDNSVTPQEAAAGQIPPGTEILPTKEGPGGFVLVKKRVLIDGNNLKSASVGTDQMGQPAIDFGFDNIGAQKFAAATSSVNIGKQFAIILDGKVMSAPSINEPIPNGRGQISGSFTYQSAGELVNVLKSGALPAKLNVEEQRTVGAELGQDAVAKGQISTLIAFLAVLIFMVLAYGFLFGGISVIALFVNLFLLVGAMSLTQATLTLPGIAGLILTLAMAVDANVLIYERMREEARAGRSLVGALDAGFSRAIVTIMDANITSIGAALIMFAFGAGPVRGFAWTLSIGIITSVFSAVMVTQVLLAWWYRAARPKTLPIA